MQEEEVKGRRICHQANRGTPSHGSLHLNQVSSAAHLSKQAASWSRLFQLSLSSSTPNAFYFLSQKHRKTSRSHFSPLSSHIVPKPNSAQGRLCSSPARSFPTESPSSIYQSLRSIQAPSLGSAITLLRALAVAEKHLQKAVLYIACRFPSFPHPQSQEVALQ